MADAVASARQWDLIPRMTPFLDRHLVLPLLEFLEEIAVRHLRAYCCHVFLPFVSCSVCADDRN